jgi:hypothetical protein
VRCVALFVGGYAINATLHECAHALTANALGVPATLFHFYANIDRVHSTDGQRAVIAVAGPLFSLAFGAVFWIVYKKCVTAAGRPLFLYLAIFGLSIFLGNLASISFVGDFSRAAAIIGMPVLARYIITGGALLLLASFMFFAGREIVSAIPGPAKVSVAAVCLIVLPTLIGTALLVVVYLPMPQRFVGATVGSAVFWIFATLGVLTARVPEQPSAQTAATWLEIAVAAAAILVVRALVPGIHFR